MEVVRRRTVVEPADEAMYGPRPGYGYRWSPLPIRLIFGFAFIYHGAPKLFDMAQHGMFAGMLAGLGVPAPEVMAWVVGVAEFVGGIALILGILVRPVAVVLLFEMLVAMFLVHLPHGFSFINIVGQSSTGPVFGMPGAEVNLLYVAGLLSLLVSGAGRWSIDSEDHRARRVVTTEILQE